MASFPTTDWSGVALASEPGSPEADEALGEICRRYWFPIYTFIRSRGHDADAAGDLTQEYFVRLIDGPLLAAADCRRGRLRTLLRTDCDFFLADQRDRRMAAKRGGRRRHLSLDLDTDCAEDRYRIEPVDGLDPAGLFDRAWVFEVLAQSLERLRAEEQRSGRGRLFESLSTYLTEGSRSVPYAEVAAGLGMTVIAVQSAVQRLRARFRNALRAEVASTLGDTPTEVEIDAEIRDLFRILDGSR